MRWRKADWLLWAVGALGFWLGIHAFREALAMIVWNIAEDAPALRMGLVALGVFAVGQAGWLVARFLGGRRPTWPMGLLLAGLSLARQAFPGEVATPILACAACVVWLWWVPAYLDELVRRKAMAMAVPSVIAGLACQGALQTALHGLDLPMLLGGWAVAGTAVLAVGFSMVNWFSREEPLPEPTGAGAAASSATWGALALGPYLMLQLTLLTNLGRIQTLSGWSEAVSAGVFLLSLSAGLYSLRWSLTRLGWMSLAAPSLFLLVPGVPSHAVVWALPLIQIALTQALASAFSPSEGQGKARIYLGAAGGALLLFGLTFLFYDRFGWPVLWTAASAIVFGVGLRGFLPPLVHDRRPTLILAAITLLAVTVSLLPSAQTTASRERAPATLKVLTYNIHQGLDAESLPSAQAIARTIAKSGADLICLQEVNRGWNISGGVDLVAYLRWRFPGYHVIYEPMNGDLWGNVIMSRYAVTASGGQLYPRGASDFPRGLAWVKIPTVNGELLLVTTHFSAYDGFDGDRTLQSDALLQFWQRQPHTVIVGDFNAHPKDEAILHLTAGGLRDLPAQHGLGETFTFPASAPAERLDYLFGSADVTSTSAEVVSSTHSDHLPVAVTIEIRP